MKSTIVVKSHVVDTPTSNDSVIEYTLFDDSNSNHCLFSDSAEQTALLLLSVSTRVQHTLPVAASSSMSLKYQGVERPNFLGLSACRLRLKCGMTLPVWVQGFKVIASCMGELYGFKGAVNRLLLP